MDEGERPEDTFMPSTSFIEVDAKSIVNPVPSPDVPLQWGMNPYQGCEHGCTYCYARTTHEYLGYNAGIDFETKILVKKQAAALLRKKFMLKSWKGEAIMLSGNTDCYQPIERKLKITRSLLETCAEFKNPVGIITKNTLVTRDIDILADMAKDDLTHVVISFTSLQEDLRQILEPRTSSVKSKLQAIEKMSLAGIPVIVGMAPIIPALNSHEIMNMAKAVSEAGAMQMSYTTVRLNGEVQTLFEDWLERHFPDRKQKVMGQIADLHGGTVQDNRFNTRMKGEGHVAKMISQQMKLARKRYNLNQEIPKLNETLFRRPDQNQLSLFT